MKTLWADLRVAVHDLRYTEPALLRAHAVAAVALLAGAGITVPGVVNRWVGIALTVAAVAAPYYQGTRTRADVWSPATVDDLATLVAAFPGLADKAKKLLGAGLGAGIVREALELAAAQPPPVPPTASTA